MQYLIPFDFVDLGVVEFVWLFLAFAGLSCVAPVRNRPRAAAWTALILAGIGLLRWFSLEPGGGAWVRWLGPMLFVPLLGAGIGLAGMVRLPGWSAAVYGASMALLTLVGNPFGGLRPLDLALLTVAWGVAAMALDVSGKWSAWARRKLAGPLRGGHLFVLGFLLFCALAQPHGIGFWEGLGLVFAGWLLFAVLAQGPEMSRYVKRRLLGAPLVLLILLALSFFIMRTAKGGPFDKDKKLDPAIAEAIAAKYHLDETLPVQFRYYMVDLLWAGDMGPSFKHKDREVTEVIGHHAPHSARLGLAAVCIAVLCGVTAGLISGIRQNSVFDYASMAAATLGLALPTFIVGPMLVLVFAMKLDWFSVTGWEDFPRDLVLPAITLSLPFMARIARLTRAGMLEVVNQDYIRTARAKGLSETAIVLRHTLKGTLLPVVSFLGPGIAQLLTGSLVVEKIFGIPGLGNEFVQAALNRDYGVAMGLVLVFGALLIFFNLVVDLLYAFLDPRIRHG